MARARPQSGCHASLAARPPREAGTVLIVAMWIVLVLAGLTLVFARSMRVEVAAAANEVAGAQAEAAARGALQFVISVLDGTDGAYTPADEASFEAAAVGDAWFWVLKPSLDDDQNLGFGLRDEAALLNLNSATSDMLLKLPNMSAELAASIVDWRDSDNDISPGGAESEYYLLLDDPYNGKNGPFETVDELMLVKGCDASLLFGEDANRNGVLDENEDDADSREPADNRDGRLDRGLAAYLTVYSREGNQTSATGEPPINVNDMNTQPLAELLRGVVNEDRFYQLMDRVRRGRPYANVLDFYARTELTPAEFVPVADRLTTGNQQPRNGLVNVRTAPREVLLCLPGLEESDVDALISRRGSTDAADLTSIAWVAEALPREKAAAIGSDITTRSFQYSADILAVSGDGRAFRRYRAVLDASVQPPRVLLWMDLTHLGWPLSLDILDSLRAGNGLGD